MIIRPQTVQITWNNRMIKYYQEKGYTYTKTGDIFEVNVDDLTINSNTAIKIKCDSCGKIRSLQYQQAIKNTFHYCLDGCSRIADKYTDEQLLESFNKFVYKNNKLPECSEMQVQAGYISHYNYIKRYGSWNNFLTEIGILDEDGWIAKEKDIIIQMYPTERQEDIISALNNKYTWGTIINKARSLELKRKCLYTERGYTKNELINAFWKFYDENDRYPYAKEMTYPTSVAYQRVFGSWDDFLKEIEVLGELNWYKCDEQVLKEYYSEHSPDFIIDKLMIKRKWGGIKVKAASMGLKRNKPLVRRKLSDEYLIDMLLKFHTENGRTPTNHDFDKDVSYPSSAVYQKRFGSWNKALKIANLETNCLMKHSKKMVVNEVLSFFEQHKRSPNYNELTFGHNLIKNYWAGWHDMLTDLNLPTHDEVCKLKSEEDGVAFLVSLSDQLGRVPVGADVENIPNINRAWFANMFGSWKKALLQAGIITEEEFSTRDQIIKNSVDCLKELSELLDRCPSVQEYDNFIKTKNEKTYSRKVLSVNLNMSFIEICDEYLEYDALYSGYSRTIINKNKRKCRSLGEVDISNLLIDNNIDLIYEPAYKDVIYTERCGYKFDWSLVSNGEIIYVEYFGLYDESGNSEISQGYVEKTHKKIELCANNELILIALYPDDIKNNYSGLIDKFKKESIILET